MKRNVLVLGAAAVIAGLPIAAVLASGGESDAAPTHGQSVTGASTDDSAASEEPAAPAETTTSASTAPTPPPPRPVPVPVPGGGDDDDHDDDD